MAINQASQLIQHLRRVLLHDEAGVTDGQLLGRFIEHRDEAAFAALVKRHGQLVWNVCRRLLNEHDAEDAFQATFLVLCRKATSIRHREFLASWLYGVAHQTALQARRTAARRRAREKQVVDMPEPAVVEQTPWNDLQTLLDQELSRLPEDYRVVLLLCDLEGKTRKEVARQLRLPEGTVASRLARARAMLAKRLARHGPALSGAALAVVLSEKAMAVSVPTSAVYSTIKAATLLAAGHAAATGVVSAKVAALTQGVLKSMLLSKLKTATAGLVLMGALLSGAGAIYRTQAAEQPEKENQPPAVKRDNSDAPLLASKKSNEGLAFLEIPDEQGERKERKSQPLTSKELSGTWQGEKEGVKVQITFRENGKDTWEVNVQKSPHARDMASAELMRVDDKQVGIVRLRFDSKQGSVVIGQIERDKAGTLRLTILPAAAKHGPYRPVEGIALRADAAGRR